MSRSLRYSHPDICDHLARQYVAGSLTTRVRQRVQTLSLTVPELEQAIAVWSDSFAELHQQLPEPRVNAKRTEQVWQAIERRTINVSTPQSATTESWFSQLWLWKATTAMGAFASLLLTISLWNTAFSPSIAPADLGPNYLANMSIHQDTEQAVQFVISAYVKQEGQPSRLHLQWTKSRTADSTTELHLWAEDKKTGELAYIGIAPEEGQAWDLSKPEWLAITNSRRLLMTHSRQFKEEDIAFSGLCLQLKDWKA